MTILEQIYSSATEVELFQLVEENILDIETPLSWSEEADMLEQEGDVQKAHLLRAAVKRIQNF